MKITELEMLIASLGNETGKDVSEMIAEIAEFVKMKYSTITTEEENKIIVIVQNKLINGLYLMSNHTYVTSRPNYKKVFNLDDLEFKFWERAANELGELNLLEGNQNYIKLIEKGVLEAKKLRGELK